MSGFARSTGLRDVRLLVRLATFAVLSALAIECLSSYILYRHYSNLNHDFYPSGLATVVLVRGALNKLGARHDNELELTVDHGPLFRAEATLGYSMYPGKYQITEKRSNQSHRFDLTVDHLGRRITGDRPNTASKYLYIAGDSAMFGWGLYDEETLPWLLQTRFPQYNVVNLSLTSYSTIQALQQLERSDPKVTADDIVVLTYHPITNDFNVISSEMLEYLESGFEQQLGDADLINNLVLPYGSVGAHGKLVVGHFPVDCARTHPRHRNCPQRQLSPDEANQVTERAFDAILAAQPGHVVVAFLGGADFDPVIEYLRSKGVTIVDLRAASSDPDATDQLSIDTHAGPFRHRRLADRLGDALTRTGLIQ